MAAVFTPGMLCVCIHRQSFYCGNKNGFLQSFTCTSIEESIQSGKNELDSIVPHISWLKQYCKLQLQQQILLIALCKLATEPGLKENLNSQGKHIIILHTAGLLSASSCSGPPNQLPQSWSSVNSLWDGNYAGAHLVLEIFVSSGLVLSTHYRKWFLLLLTAFLWNNYI